MNRYRLSYYWTDHGGGCETRTLDLSAYTAADAITQAELQIARSPRHWVASGDGWNKGEWKIDRYYAGIRSVEPLAAADHAPETAVRAEANTTNPHRTILQSLGGSAPCVWCGLFTRYWDKVPVCPTPPFWDRVRKSVETLDEPLAAADHIYGEVRSD